MAWKAVLFDMDGVLIDSEEYMAKTGVRALKKYGIDAKESDFAEFVGCGENRYVGGVAEKYGVPYRTEMKDYLYACYGEHVKEEANIPDGVLDVLHALRTRGYRLAVCSSADRIKVLMNLSAIGEGKSIIFISHKMREVLRISDRITILRLGKVVGTVDRAETDGQKLAGMMIGKELTESHYEKVDASGHEIVAELDHVDYNKESKHSGLADLSLRIHAGEIVGVAGVDGNGQTQLAQLITGVIAPEGGTVRLKGDRVAVFDPNGFIEHGVSHVPEDRNLQGLIGDMSIAENLVLKDTDDPRFSHGHGLRLNKRAIHAYAQSMMEKYDVRATSDSQSVRELSGGNQQKVIIARELESGPSVLVMAHPTRGLDIGATSFVHDQMIAARARGVGILLISADFDEILEMSDRIVVCFEGRIMGEFSGSKPPINEISLAMTGK